MTPITLKKELKYYQYQDKAIGTSVSYYLLDDKGVKEVNYPAISCYGNILTYGIVPETCKILETYVAYVNLPYSNESVTKWVELINEWGFPIEEVRFEENSVYFKFDLDKYPTKEYLTSALMILRYLWESGFNVIPAITLDLMEENPEADTFELMLFAHSQINQYIVGAYYNTNHMLRDGSLQRLVSKDTMLEKLKGTKHSLSQRNRNDLYTMWVGSPVNRGNSSFKDIYKLIKPI